MGTPRHRACRHAHVFGSETQKRATAPLWVPRYAALPSGPGEAVMVVDAAEVIGTKDGGQDFA